MTVIVKLFATLRNNRFDEKAVDISENSVVHDLLLKIGITDKDAAIIFINGRHSDLTRQLEDGDTVAIFPPIGGGSLTP